MTTKHLSFQKERQKLINNWPEDEAERKSKSENYMKYYATNVMQKLFN